MKKVIAFVMAIAMIFSMAIVASADSTTTLTTNVPPSTYTLNIPKNQEIKFGALSADIGNVTLSDGVGFATGKNVEVTVTYTDFICEGVSTTIPFTLEGTYTYTYASTGPKYNRFNSGDSMLFLGGTNWFSEALHPVDNNYTMDKMTIHFNSEDWGKALAGDYTATITFAAKVVAG